MNFALRGIIIIVLLLPGAVAQKSYYSSFVNKEASISIPISDLLIQGIFWCFFLHASFICLLHLFNYQVNFHFLYDVLIAKDEKDFNFTNTQFSNYVREFIGYILSISVVAFLAGKSLKYIVRLRGLNLRFNGLINYNYWFYIFSADYADVNLEITGEDVDLIYLDIMVSAETIYCGILIDFNYSSHKDELENVVLEGAKRRKVDKDHSLIGTAVPIPGDIFVVNMKNVLNINVKYLTLTEK